MSHTFDFIENRRRIECKGALYSDLRQHSMYQVSAPPRLLRYQYTDHRGMDGLVDQRLWSNHRPCATQCVPSREKLFKT